MGMRVSVKCDAIKRALIITQVDNEPNGFEVNASGFLPMYIKAANVAEAQSVAFANIANMQRDPEHKAKVAARKAEHAAKVARGEIQPRGRKPRLSKTG